MKRWTIHLVENYLVAGDGKPRESSQFHTFPSLSGCSDGSFLCTALVGSEKSGPDGRTKVWRSTDNCATWTPVPSPTAHDEQADPRWGYLMCHITEIRPGRLLAAYLRADRFDSTQPLFHPETSGMQHTVIRLSESTDNGAHWSEPRDLDYSIPDLMAPGGLLRPAEGVLGLPVEVWHEWDRGWREGPSTRLILSYDHGRTWPEAGLIARDATRRCIYGDPRLTTLPDGRLVVLLWAHDTTADRDLTVHRSESADGGRTWSPITDTGLVSQIANPAALDEGLMLAVYQLRFGEEAGLRAVLSYDNGNTWDERSDTVLQAHGRHTDDENPFSGYEEFSFGYSTVHRVSGREVLVPFWASNGKTTCIRILRVRVD